MTIKTREYELIEELLNRGATMEDINRIYKLAEQEKRKEEREIAINKAREKVAEAIAEYAKLLTGIDIDVTQLIKDVIEEEKKINNVDSTKTKVKYKTDAVSEWLKENDLF